MLENLLDFVSSEIPPLRIRRHSKSFEINFALAQNNLKRMVVANLQEGPATPEGDEKLIKIPTLDNSGVHSLSIKLDPESRVTRIDYTTPEGVLFPDFIEAHELKKKRTYIQYVAGCGGETWSVSAGSSVQKDVVRELKNDYLASTDLRYEAALDLLEALTRANL